MENGSSINDEVTQCQKYGTSVCVKRKCAHNRIYDAERSILDNDLMQVTAIKKVFEKYDACTFITTITIQRIMHCTLTLTLSTHSEVASDFLLLGLLGLRYWR